MTSNKNLTSPHSQVQRRKVAAIRVSLLSNLLLIVLKLTVGFFSGSISILSEAAHSTTDLFASVIALFALAIADRAPDEDHPYGHGKVESLFGLAEGLLLASVAAFIVRDAISRFRNQAHPQHLEWGMAVMAASALVNVFVVRRMLRIARLADSPALRADAENHRTDIYAATGVLFGLFLVRVTGVSMFDPALAIGVSLLIFHTAWRLAREALSPLMDRQLPEEEIEKIRSIFEGDPIVMGYHKLRTRKSGSVRHIDAHVLMEDHLTLLEAHSQTERLEDRIRDALPNALVTLHTEPNEAERLHQKTAKDANE